MRTIPFAAAALAALAIAPATAAASDALLTGRVVDRPTVTGGEVSVPLLITSGGRSRLAALAVPRAALRRPAGLRLGDRVRGRRHRWLRVTARASGPTFARLDALLAGTRQAGQQAASDLQRVAHLPPGTLTGPAAVTATRADAEQLRERLNLLDASLADLGPALDGAIGAVRAAYAGDAARFGALRRTRDARLAPLIALRDATTRARATIADATYVLDERLAVVPPTGVEIPIGTVSTVSDVTRILLELLGGGQTP
jgi:hypothetical protein